MIAASIPLAVGISADVAVVLFKTTDNAGEAMAAGIATLFAVLGFWLAYPLWRRTKG